MYYMCMKKILLPDDLHLALKIEAARSSMTLQELITLKLRQSTKQEAPVSA